MSHGETRRERKVVTVLFCDLVGFTSRAEEMDPEDVAAVLAPYQARLRAELERFGGTVEKFIGDAVMALFGAPVSHEDDPERAVRAALAIREFAEDEGIELRIGIATGEALVTLGARPDAGETMATGDVVNTAARLQAAGPVNGILVGEKTHDTTRHAIAYAGAEAVDAKGKAQPVRAWRALHARGRVQLERVHGATLVGRKRELDLLGDSLARAREERNPQLVTLVGVPGIGKSRLVLELFKLVEADSELITWRHGRCLPYGDGVTFWALGEMVKAEAGILETDSAEDTEAKLTTAVEDEWLRSHLRPLVGLATDQELAGDRRSEAFVAWRGFFEKLAEARPLVLVFEDLHWADESLLDFVDHLVDWAGGVPLLVVCTSRPELLERRPGWGGGKTNALTISLSPLSDDDTARLIAELLEQPVLDAARQSALLARAEGNPLYAEQYVRMLLEQGDAEGLRLPETVQGIIAARLDGLAPAEKALLGDAAVLGRTFPVSGLAAVTGAETRTLESLLHGLERKEFVRRERRAARSTDAEYAFRHMLVRDVAYGQIPRADRSEKHRLTAEWIQSLGRPDDHAELLAHHYADALDLARAAGAELDGLAEVAQRAFVAAGDRASDLNAFGPAAGFYERALELTPIDDPERTRLLLRYGAALRWGRAAGQEVLAEAYEGLVAAGDAAGAAEAAVLLADLHWGRGLRGPADDYIERAASLVREAESSRAKAYVLAQLARFDMLASRTAEAIRVGREAVALAEQLGLDDVRANALNTIGTARASAGDPEGVADVELSLEIALAINSPREILRAYNNLLAMLGRSGDLRRARQLWPLALEAAERFGERTLASGVLGNRLNVLYETGDWDEALSAADAFIAETEAGVFSGMQVAPSRGVRAHIRFAREDTVGALDDFDKAAEFMRAVGTGTDKVAAICDLALAQLEAGDPETAAQLADEAVALARTTTHEGLAYPGPVLLFGLLGRADELSELLEECSETKWLEAARHGVRGQWEHAADVCHEIGHVPFEARMRLQAAEQLLGEGRRPEADVQLAKALAFHRRVGATRYIRQAEALLAAAS